MDTGFVGILRIYLQQISRQSIDDPGSAIRRYQYTSGRMQYAPTNNMTGLSIKLI